MKPLREMPGLFYKEMCEAGALGFIQSAPVPLRALYDRALLNDPHTTFDNLPEVCDIKLDEHQYKIIKQMVKERRNFWLEFDIRNHFKLGPVKYHNYNPQIQISAESGTKRSIFRQKNKTKRSKNRLHTTLIKPEQKVNEDLCSGFVLS
jgi:hypothetical protein